MTGLPGAVLIGLGWLVRPELVVYSALFVALVFVADRDRTSVGERLRILAAALALPAAYQVFRMGYFGSMLPNTAIAKEGNSTNWSRGWDYLVDFAQPYWLWIMLLVLVAGGYVPFISAALRKGELRPIAVAAAFVACAAAHATYLVAVGGDYHHARLLMPALLALCVPVAVVPATRPHAAGLVLALWAAVSAFALRPPQYTGEDWFATGFLLPREFGNVTSDSVAWGDAARDRAWYTGPAYYYESRLGMYRRGDVKLADDVRVPVGAFFGVGIAGYAVGTDFRVLDLLGLADPFTAHLETTGYWNTLRRGPGHEKPLPSPWIAARLTAPGTTPNRRHFPDFGSNPLIPVTAGREFQEQVAWARAALQCDEIDDLM